jgi:DNA polymerase III delta prime subunit
MAKTPDAQQTNTAQDEDKKQQNKQIKRKEKLMLKIEEARKEVQKAEKKFAKAQSNLEASQSLLRELEEGLIQIREKHAEQPESPAATAPVERSYEHPQEIRVPDQGESYEDREVVEELHQSSLPPVEGRSDILTNNDGSTAAIPSSSETETDQSGSSSSTAESSPQ